MNYLKIEEISCNKTYYNWFPYTINKQSYIVFSFKVSKDKIQELEFCKKVDLLIVI